MLIFKNTYCPLNSFVSPICIYGLVDEASVEREQHCDLPPNAHLGVRL